MNIATKATMIDFKVDICCSFKVKLIASFTKFPAKKYHEGDIMQQNANI